LESSVKLSNIILKGSVVYSIRQVVVTFVSLVTTLALTRLLQPIDFGYISFVTIVLSSITLLSDGGLGVCLIQKKEIVLDTDISEITNIQLGLWMLFQALILLLLVSIYFFSKMDINGILFLFVASFSIPFAIFKAGSIIYLERSLSFKQIAIIETIEQFIFTLTAIILTLFNFGVWSIIIANLLKVFCSYLLANYFYPWNYTFISKNKSKYELISLIKKGLSYQIPSILETLRSAINPIFIGLIFGMKYAGFTDRAILIASIPISFLGTIFQKILFPLVARIQTEKESLKNIFEKAVYFHSIFDKAVYLPLFLYGETIIKFFLGEKWLPILPVVLIFSLGNIFFSAYTTTLIAFFKGLGQPNILAYWSFIQLPLAIISVYICVHFFGFIGYAIGSQVLWFGIIYFHFQMKKNINIIVFKSILLPLIAFALTYLFMKFIFSSFHKPENFIFPSILSFFIYLILLLLIDYKQIKNSLSFSKIHNSVNL
jgi:O-antigen/teichoic acid export membrane protein